MHSQFFLCHIFTMSAVLPSKQKAKANESLTMSHRWDIWSLWHQPAAHVIKVVTPKWSSKWLHQVWDTELSFVAHAHWPLHYFTLSLFPPFTLSHLHAFTLFLHIYSFTVSFLHTFTLPLFHTFTLSHFHSFTLSHWLTHLAGTLSCQLSPLPSAKRLKP